MLFQFTPEEAQTTAARVANWLQSQLFHVEIESAVSEDAPYRTSILGNKSGFFFLIEAQGSLVYGGQLERFASWLSARRLHCELFLAVPEDSALHAKSLRDLRRDGVGLLLVGADESVEITLKARNPALIVTPDPTLVLGGVKPEVSRFVARFNDGERKDALRDMCELVERETQRLLTKLAKRGWVRLSEQAIRRMSWANQIDIIASGNQYQGGRTPVLSGSERDDLQSFRGARNLIDHKAGDRREEARREQQFAERMIQGPRLVALLVRLQRKVR